MTENSINYTPVNITSDNDKGVKRTPRTRTRKNALPPRFAAIHLESAHTQQPCNDKFEVTFNNGLKIAVPAGFEYDDLARILTVMHRHIN